MLLSCENFQYSSNQLLRADARIKILSSRGADKDACKDITALLLFQPPLSRCSIESAILNSVQPQT